LELIKAYSLEPLEFDGQSPCNWAYDPARTFIVCGYKGGRIIRWFFDDTGKVKSTEFMENERRSAFLAFQERFAEPIQDIAISSNDAFVASANHGRYPNFTVKVWNPKDSNIRYTLPISRSWVLAVAFSPDSKWLAVGGDNRKVVLYNTDSGLERHYEPITFRYSVSSLAFSPDGRYLVIGCDGCLIVVLDLANDCEACRIRESHNEWTRSLAFTSNGTLFASGGDDGAVELWNAVTGQLKEKLSWPHADNGVQAFEFSRVAFSKDGRYVAGAAMIQRTSESIIAVWNADSGELWQYIKQLQRSASVDYASMIRSVAFSDDTHWLVTGDSDCTLSFWDLER
jgi:WD40 repeat protein